MRIHAVWEYATARQTHGVVQGTVKWLTVIIGGGAMFLAIYVVWIAFALLYGFLLGPLVNWLTPL